MEETRKERRKGYRKRALGSLSGKREGGLKSEEFRVCGFPTRAPDSSRMLAGRQVGYELTDFTSLAALTSASGVVGSDSFEYAVADALGFNSTVATVRIFVATPVNDQRKGRMGTGKRQREREEKVRRGKETARLFYLIPSRSVCSIIFGMLLFLI